MENLEITRALRELADLLAIQGGRRPRLGFLGLGAQPPTPEWGSMLANALYFKASWQDDFYDRATQPATFALSAEKTIEVPMMRAFSRSLPSCTGAPSR